MLVTVWVEEISCRLRQQPSSHNLPIPRDNCSILHKVRKGQYNAHIHNKHSLQCFPLTHPIPHLLTHLAFSFILTTIINPSFIPIAACNNGATTASTGFYAAFYQPTGQTAAQACASNGNAAFPCPGEPTGSLYSLTCTCSHNHLVTIHVTTFMSQLNVTLHTTHFRRIYFDYWWFLCSKLLCCCRLYR